MRSRPLARFGGVEPLLHATGLAQPRGMLVESDGSLLVAEAGGIDAAGAPVRGSIARVDSAGNVTRLAEATVPFRESRQLWDHSGPSALFRSTSLEGAATYVLAGPISERAAARILLLAQSDGQHRLERPVDVAAPGSDAARGAPWGAATLTGGDTFTVLPLANLLVSIRAGGPAQPPAVTPVTGFVGAGGRNPLPSGVAAGPDGALYVSFFAADAERASSGRVVRVEQDGRWQPLYEGLTFPVALAFSAEGQLYVLEFSSGYDPETREYAPRSGRLVAVGPAPARRRTVVREINYPTALTIGLDGDAFFTENGAQSAAGEGHILRVPAQTLRSVP